MEIVRRVELLGMKQDRKEPVRSCQGHEGDGSEGVGYQAV